MKTKKHCKLPASEMKTKREIDRNRREEILCSEAEPKQQQDTKDTKEGQNALTLEQGNLTQGQCFQ